MCNNARILIFIMLFCVSCTVNRRPDTKVFVLPLVEWGISSIGDTVRMEIPCVNLGNDNISIDYISTPCGCITAIPRKFYIEKGDSTIIDVLYKPIDVGYTEKHMYLYLRNTKTPILITIRGKIKKGKK